MEEDEKEEKKVIERQRRLKTRAVAVLLSVVDSSKCHKLEVQPIIVGKV